MEGSLFKSGDLMSPSICKRRMEINCQALESDLKWLSFPIACSGNIRLRFSSILSSLWRTSIPSFKTLAQQGHGNCVPGLCWIGACTVKMHYAEHCLFDFPSDINYIFNLFPLQIRSSNIWGFRRQPRMSTVNDTSCCATHMPLHITWSLQWATFSHPYSGGSRTLLCINFSGHYSWCKVLSSVRVAESGYCK